jgi:hypothetical protein
MRGNAQPPSNVPQVSFHLRVVGNTDPSHVLRAAAQLEALWCLVLGGEAR